MSAEQPDPPIIGSDEAAASSSISRREFFKGAGIAATAPLSVLGKTGDAASADGTPEQIHLTWGDDPAHTMFVSWASPAQAVNPRVLLDRAGAARRVIHALQRTYTDGLNGQTVFTYHAKLDALSA